MNKLFLRASLHLRLVRMQHSAEVASPTLPSNLVVFGVANSKLQQEKQEIVVPPPGSEVPLARHCNMEMCRHQKPIKVWVDDFANPELTLEKATELHPDVFGVHPRMDVLHDVVEWQTKYREVDWNWSRSRAQLGRGKKKPWPQKHSKRIRQGSTTPPFWHKGGIAFGPRGPKSLYYRPGDRTLLKGLTIALTIKYIQNDLIIADSMEIDQPDEETFKGVLQGRNIENNTALFIHQVSDAPNNLSTVVYNARGFSIMPLVALNVWGILKHDKLVMSLNALDELEEKILWNERRYPWLGDPHNFYKDMPINRDNLGRGFMEEVEEEEVEF